MELLKKKTKKRKSSGSKKGKALLQQVIRLTGLPPRALREELKSVLDKNHIDVRQLTVEQLRTATASYLREIMGHILDKMTHRRQDLHH